jgi:hypothetical protein
MMRKLFIITSSLLFCLTEAPAEAATFLSKQGDNIIEIVSREHSRFIKYDLETGQALICRYSDDAAKAADLVYENFRVVSVNTTGTTDDIVVAVVNAAKGGRFTAKQIDDYDKLATKNPDAEKVMLGKYLDGGENSYIARAGKDHTYFDMGAEKWKEAEALVSENANEMWKINKKFIDEQIVKNKEFYFSYEPWIVQSHESLSKEAEYLIDLGAKDFFKKIYGF